MEVLSPISSLTRTLHLCLFLSTKLIIFLMNCYEAVFGNSWARFGWKTNDFSCRFTITKIVNLSRDLFLSFVFSFSCAFRDHRYHSLLFHFSFWCSIHAVLAIMPPINSLYFSACCPRSNVLSCNAKRSEDPRSCRAADLSITSHNLWPVTQILHQFCCNEQMEIERLWVFVLTSK